jgi:hypothetical protein
MVSVNWPLCVWNTLRDVVLHQFDSQSKEIVQWNQIEARVVPRSKDISIHVSKVSPKHFIFLEVIYNKRSICK